MIVERAARITIVEKSHCLLPYGQNIDIQGSARTLIKEMGFMDQIRGFTIIIILSSLQQ